MDTNLNKPEITENSEISGNTAEFREKLNESREALAEPVLEKKKRGPKGPRKPRPGSEAAAQVTPAPASPVSTAPPPDITKLVQPAIKMLGKIPADRTGIAKLALDDDESMQVAQSLDELLKAFVPDMNSMSPKTAAVLGFCSVAASIGTTKYMIYREEMVKRGPVAQPDAQAIINKEQQNFGISADQAFRM